MWFCWLRATMTMRLRELTPTKPEAAERRPRRQPAGIARSAVPPASGTDRAGSGARAGSDGHAVHRTRGGAGRDCRRGSRASQCLDRARKLRLAAEEPRHKFSTELFEIAIKTFQPAKPAPIGGEAFPSNAGPLLPNLKFLPLRPKVALATGYVPPTQGFRCLRCEAGRNQACGHQARRARSHACTHAGSIEGRARRQAAGPSDAAQAAVTTRQASAACRRENGRGANTGGAQGRIAERGRNQTSG